MARDIASVSNHIAMVKAHPQHHPMLGPQVCVALRHASLNPQRALHRVDDDFELDQGPVQAKLDDPATVHGNQPVDQGVMVRLQRSHRGRLALL